MNPAAKIKDGTLHPDYKPAIKKLKVFPIDKNLSLEEKIGRAHRLREYHLTQARNDFHAFLEYCFVDPQTRIPFEIQWFHDEWIDAIESNLLSMIIAPRNHGKTGIIIPYIAWRLGKNPDLRVKILCQDTPTAIKRLGFLKRVIETNKKVQEVFPDLMPEPGGVWAKEQIIIKRNMIDPEPSVEAKGILGGITGARADLIIADDVVGRRNALSKPAERVSVKSAWYDDVMNLIDETSQVIYICTLWHRDDLSHELRASNAYTVKFYAIQDDFGSIWPGRWSERALRSLRARSSSAAWARGFKNVPMDESDQVVKEAWLQFGNVSGLDPSKLIFLTSYDLATKLKEANDFFSSCTAAIDPDNNHVYIVDWWHSKLTQAHQESIVMREYRRYHPVKALIEIVGQANLDERILENNPFMAGIVEPVNPKNGKHERMHGITQLLEHGHVTFAEHLDPDSENFDPSRGNGIAEILDFGIAKHDDMADSFSQVLNGAREFVLDKFEYLGDNEIDVEVISC
jgi:phage terminase large subunit-like protein